MEPYLEDEGLKLYEIKANKMPLAYYPGKENEGFTNHSLQLQEGDMIYIASDGFPDQFGEPKGKKFMYKKFKKLLMSLYAIPIEE
ncbi:SpoIIE family protein phosphatase [Flavobacteriales bacterium]|nr:SpoIIE family protein phosphatase [Flavobacteriales bacterium]